MAVSGANQYSVNPLALVSTVTPAILAVLRAPPAGVGPGPLACATEMPNTISAAMEMPATARPAPGRPAGSLAGGGLPEVGPAGRPRTAGAAARAASAAKAATSITPAAIPAMVRVSLNPNRPIHTDRR